MFNQSDIDKMYRFSKGLSNAEETRYIYSLFADNEGEKEFKQHIQKEFNECQTTVHGRGTFFKLIIFKFKEGDCPRDKG